MRASLPLLATVLASCCPQTGPDAWSDCWADPRSTDCGIVIPVTIGEVPATPSIACTGFEAHARSGCDEWPGVVNPVVRGGRYMRPFGPTLVGSTLDLEIEMSGETGRARFCRRRITDCCGNDCPPSDWACAIHGTLVLSGPLSTTVHGEIDATFGDGGTVHGVF